MDSWLRLVSKKDEFCIQNEKVRIKTRNFGFKMMSFAGIWKKNIARAVEDGQKLIVYSRRNWKNRVNHEDLSVSMQENRSWPGMPIDLKKGHPIDKYGHSQEREIAWLKKQPFFATLVEFREIESLDALRADIGGGLTYHGQWDLNDEIDGRGVANCNRNVNSLMKFLLKMQR